MLCIGIDISKASFDCALSIEDVDQHQSFNNDKKGFKALTKWLKSLDATHERVFCMEVTGVYGVALAGYLYQSDEKVIVVNPIKTNAFAKMEMTRNKTDALSIVRYCQHIVACNKIRQKPVQAQKRSLCRFTMSGDALRAVKQTVEPGEQPFAGELGQSHKQINQVHDPPYQAANAVD